MQRRLGHIVDLVESPVLFLEEIKLQKHHDPVAPERADRAALLHGQVVHMPFQQAAFRKPAHEVVRRAAQHAVAIDILLDGRAQFRRRQFRQRTVLDGKKHARGIQRGRQQHGNHRMRKEGSRLLADDLFLDMQQPPVDAIGNHQGYPAESEQDKRCNTMAGIPDAHAQDHEGRNRQDHRNEKQPLILQHCACSPCRFSTAPSGS